MLPIDVYSLNIGDEFVEDCCQDKYKVVGYEGSYILAENLTNGKFTHFGYTVKSHAPILFLLEDDD